MSRRDQILAKISDITSLPVAAAEALRLLHKPDAGISEIMRAIEVDPVLTADVLHLANTAYFAGPRAIATLRDASVLLGSQRILELVLASAVLPIASSPVRGYDMPAGQLVRQSLATAVGAELICKLLGKTPPGHTFTAGLLADIGKIVLGSFLEVDVKPILAMALGEKVSFEVAERSVLGTDHAEVGAALLDAWNLPGHVVQIARWHHEPNRFEGDKFVVDLVHITGFLSAGCSIGTGLDGLNYELCQDSVARLEIKQELLERAACDMLVALSAIEEHLPGTGKGEEI